MALAACKAATLTAVHGSELYGIKKIDNIPFDLWQARVRMDGEATEKALGASGKEAIFFRPSMPSQLPSASSFTIVWAKKGTDACSSTLASMLQSLAKIAGHRGLCRSLSALGARIPWTSVREARLLFTPEDKRFDESLIAIRDETKFRLDGVPAGATAPELARYLREVKWVAIPQRRLQAKTNATWLVSAAEAPSQRRLRWGEANILITQLEDDDKMLQRQADRPGRKQGNKASEPVQQRPAGEGMKEEDSLQKADPWSRWMNKSSSVTGQALGGARETRSSSSAANAQVFDMAVDPRITSLSNRMDKMEAEHGKLAGQVQNMDGKLTNLQTDMASQFQQVLQGLASLQEMQNDAKKHKGAANGSS